MKTARDFYERTVATPTTGRNGLGISRPSQILLVEISLGFVASLLLLAKFGPRAIFTLGFAPASAYTSENPLLKSPTVLAELEAVSEFAQAFHIGPLGTGSKPAVFPAAREAQTDSASELTPLQAFLDAAPKRIQSMRLLLLNLGRNQSDAERATMLNQLHAQLGDLKGAAGLRELLPVWQLTYGLEGLVKQLAEKRERFTPSTLRTVAAGVDLLKELCKPGLKPDLCLNPPIRLLAVDDDQLTRRAIAFALKKGLTPPDLAENGPAALALAEKKPYDVIFLDVQMPEMDGFEVCTKIHQTECNRITPVVFVTVSHDFNSRAKSTLAGGNDLIPKPFLTFEITVKALTLAITRRLQEQKSEKPAVNPPTAAPAPVPVQPEAVAAANAPATPKAENTEAAEEAAPVASSPIPIGAPNSHPGTEFFTRLTVKLKKSQKLAQAINETTHTESRQKMLTDLYLHLSKVVEKPDFAAAAPAALLGSNLLGLLKKLLEDPKYVTPSALRTVSNALDLMRDLCAKGINPRLASEPPIHLLVVDDDPICTRALSSALQMAFAKPDNAADGEEALTRCTEKTYDVIFLDVQMPGMDGFTACLRIRETAANHQTPVVFVTAHNDVKTRTQASICGGQEFISKPFLKHEVVVKALTFALHHRLHAHRAESANPGRPNKAAGELVSA
jgi:CheY-like chemotaxis protein